MTDLLIATPEPWTADALCTGSTHLMFDWESMHGARADTLLTRARAMCTACPVTEQCLDYAQRTDQQHGMWGGRTPEERGHRRGHRRPSPSTVPLAPHDRTDEAGEVSEVAARDDYPMLPGASTSMYYADLCDEIDRLREQLARQAPVIEAARLLEDAVNRQDRPSAKASLARLLNVVGGIRMEDGFVRALSVPAPPEATEVTG